MAKQHHPRFIVKDRGDRYGVIDTETNERVIGPVEKEVAERRADEENRHAQFRKDMGLKRQ